MNPVVASLDPVFLALARFGLAILFFAAALHKIRDMTRFAETVRNYRVLPAGLAGGGARALAASEAGAGAFLLVPALDPVGAFGALGLLGLYSGVIGINLARGRRHIDCGCLGFGEKQSISGWLLVRNAGLALLPLALLAPMDPRPLAWLDFFSIVAGLGLAVLLWLSAQRLAAAAASGQELGLELGLGDPR